MKKWIHKTLTSSALDVKKSASRRQQLSPKTPRTRLSDNKEWVVMRLGITGFTELPDDVADPVEQIYIGRQMVYSWEDQSWLPSLKVTLPGAQGRLHEFIRHCCNLVPGARVLDSLLTNGERQYLSSYLLCWDTSYCETVLIFAKIDLKKSAASHTAFLYNRLRPSLVYAR